MRFGMRFLVRWALRFVLVLSLIAIGLSIPAGGQPPLWFLIGYLMLAFFAVGILFGNQNALAMEPLGHLAGVGAAVVGSLSSWIGMPLGALIGQGYNGTIYALLLGMAVLSALALLSFVGQSHRTIARKQTSCLKGFDR